jgi:hypothetical protein
MGEGAWLSVGVEIVGWMGEGAWLGVGVEAAAGSGVMIRSGVETADVPLLPRPSPSIPSCPFCKAFKTLLLGNVPRAAMFSTAPCRSIPA